MNEGKFSAILSVIVPPVVGLIASRMGGARSRSDRIVLPVKGL